MDDDSAPVSVPSVADLLYHLPHNCQPRLMPLLRRTMTDTPIFSKLANDPDFLDLVRAFVADMPIRSGKILALIRGGSIDDAAELLHQLKGAAGIYGYQPIHLLAKEVESLLKSGDPILEEQASELDRLCQRASAEPN